MWGRMHPGGQGHRPAAIMASRASVSRLPLTFLLWKFCWPGASDEIVSHKVQQAE